MLSEPPDASALRPVQDLIQEAVTKQDTNGQATDNIQWWAPEIGVVEATVHATQPGFENHITLKLISTNVTPPATPGAKVHPE